MNAPTRHSKPQPGPDDRPELAPPPYREAERPSLAPSVLSAIKLEETAPSGLCDPDSVKTF